jgi:hypothetical protein
MLAIAILASLGIRDRRRSRIERAGRRLCLNLNRGCRGRRLRRKLIVVCLFQQLLNVLSVLGLFQEPTERIVAQLARDVLEGSQVVARTVGW